MLGLSLKRKTGCCVPPLGKCLQWKAFSITPCINWLCFTDTKTGDEYKYIHRGPWPSVCLSLSFKGTVHPKIKNSYFSYFSLPVGLFYSSRLFWCKLSSLEDICHGAVGLSSNIMEVDGTHGFWFSKCQKPKQKKGQNQLSSNVFFPQNMTWLLETIHSPGCKQFGERKKNKQIFYWCIYSWTGRPCDCAGWNHESRFNVVHLSLHRTALHIRIKASFTIMLQKHTDISKNQVRYFRFGGEFSLLNKGDLKRPVM